MALKRDSNCPLCGARLKPTDLLDAATELIDPVLGVLETRCPHCQGRLELLPESGHLDIGYLVGDDSQRFDVALTLVIDGLEIERGDNPPVLTLTAAGRTWKFSE
jgi:hypothetical protein